MFLKCNSQIIVCCLLFNGSFQVARAQAKPDGNTIVKKMMAKYHSLNSFQEVAEAKVIENNSQMIQSSTLKYQKPQNFSLTSIDPQIGTVLSQVNEKGILVYSGKQNIFTRRKPQPTLKDSLNRLQNASLYSLRIPVTQALSPLSFLAASTMPVEANQFRLTGVRMVAGRPAYVVRALAKLEWLQSLAKGVTILAKSRGITLYIDKQSFLLVRATCAITFMTTLPGEPLSSKPTNPAGFAFDEYHRAIIENGAINAQEFNFTLPAGALEKYANTQDG